MQPAEDKENPAKPLSVSEESLFGKYGKLSREGLIGQQSKVLIIRSIISRTTLNNFKQRRYFDSGDFALSAADRVTENGAIQPGSAHPQRDSISHPYAPIPSSSNVGKDANKDISKQLAGHDKSPLLQQMNIEGKTTTKESQNPIFSRKD
ncbi:hypothetical protein N7540_002258 [Penicillium herquei]|nr:hypothetical protein N7540_002258 [Penicillium herquei]